MGKYFGPKARKKSMIVMSTSVVWLATGLWHGTGINYLLWGGYWGIIIAISEIFAEMFQKINHLLKINTDSPTWKMWQVFRTFMIFSIGRMIATQPDLRSVNIIVMSIIKKSNYIGLFDIATIGLTEYDWKILAWAIVVLVVVDLYQEYVGSVRKSISEWNIIPRYIFYCLALTVIILCGVYGTEYDINSFAYQLF